MKNFLQLFFLAALFVLGQIFPVAFCQTASAQKSVKEIASLFKSLDMDSDGTNEIDKLTLMSFRGVEEKPLVATDKLVVVLIENRLFEKIPRSETSARDLKNRLKQYKNDLEKEGLTSRFVDCELYAGPKHQDGQTLLALRRFLKDVNNAWNLQGVVLVGSFPEATLVRRWIWKRQRWNVTIAGKPYKGADQTDFLRIVPEPVAPRADIVLADLDGNWEDIYEKESRQLESIEALPDKGVAK